MATGSAIHRWRTRFGLSWPAESTATARARLANGDGEREPACGRRVGLPRKAIVEDQHLLPRVRRRESPDLDDSLDRETAATQIAENYLRFIRVYEEQETAVA